MEHLQEIGLVNAANALAKTARHFAAFAADGISGQHANNAFHKLLGMHTAVSELGAEFSEPAAYIADLIKQLRQEQYQHENA